MERAYHGARAGGAGAAQRRAKPDVAHEAVGVATEIIKREAALEQSRTEPIAAAKAGRPFPTTDLGNAERLIAYYGDQLHWDTAHKCWRVWDGKRWQLDSALTVNALAAQAVRKIRDEANAAPPPPDNNSSDLRAMLYKHALRSESAQRLKAMVDVAKSQPSVAVAAKLWDADLYALNVDNGTINLKTGALKSHDRADMLTKLSPVKYDPDAKCDRWRSFLRDATDGDTEKEAFLQRAAGYTLTGSVEEEVLFFVHGPEAACKSTFLESMRTVLGDYARTIQTELLVKKPASAGGGASPEIAGLAGARLAAGSEIEQGTKLAEALVKNITGGEAVTARHLFAECFDFFPQFKLWVTLNHVPRVSADDGAIWRRILRLAFDHSIPKDQRDKTLKPYLRDAHGGGPAVLAWAVRGCIAWQDSGLQIPDCVITATEQYREESDPLASFFKERIIFDFSENWVAWATIWDEYQSHAESEGVGEKYRVSPRHLQTRLRGSGCKRQKCKIGHGWTGLRIIENSETPLLPGVFEDGDPR